MTGSQERVDWWVKYFRTEYVAKNGRDCAHLMIPGRTGGGKTTVMFWILESIIKLCMMQFGSSAQQETVVWYDTGKSSEALTLLSMWRVVFLIPRGMTLNINLNPNCKVAIHEYDVITMNDPMNPWQYIRKGWINVICLKPYIIEPSTYSVIASLTLKKLIRLAHKKLVVVPLALFIDEMQELAPATGHAFDRTHEEAAKWMALNMKMVRSLGIRIIGATHDLYELRKGVRKEMAWHMPKEGTNYDRWEEPRLSKFNELWASLSALMICIVRPDRKFSDKIEIEYYPRGEGPDGIGEMVYGGEIDEDVLKNFLKEKKQKDQAKPAPSENDDELLPRKAYDKDENEKDDGTGAMA